MERADTQTCYLMDAITGIENERKEANEESLRKYENIERVDSTFY